ncbi:MAG: peroxidase-related enzyme [Candidatus Korarchaeota archaeon]|nr:peroxidase-related enzyme [Candidatus Korarchaeota archaeon]NIU83774.1 peroxidase-related enzyme [Candidatus Thorarchaeota archaeon]NIW15359.1 peroxidase-related enzyme [Candidatus Thorarchaeota archaeon]NIW52085.1 peroxidase-related enzyme [Candidatus Korarchaeota archaeon]
MTWIDVIDESEAEGRLKEIYEKLKEKRGKIANIMKVHSLNPQAMKAHMDLYLTAMFTTSSLSRETCELIAVVVSKANECEYCLAHHTEALNYYWNDREKLKKWLEDVNTPDLPKRKLQIVDYAVRLTKAPGEMTKNEVRKLKEVGLTDREIHDVALIASYFNFVNRIAKGLGLHFSPEELKGYNY